MKNTRSLNLRCKLIISLLILPLLVSCFTSTNKTKKENIFFTVKERNLNIVSDTEKVKVNFPFEIKGKKVQIDTIFSDCDCSVVSLKRRKYYLGQRDTVVVTYHAVGKGVAIKRIYVYEKYKDKPYILYLRAFNKFND